ncbi:MAG TPA: alpha-D-glucose phosphate-specific phosphoglucomutase, partial [Chloroflexota bacterium]|nr:alpha-D-glucose phosphate-specific phosphoglucomutase [Chloroflexota bacterium]
DGGFKYNPPSGGPAASDTTAWIQSRANALLASGLDGIQRLGLASALRSPTTHRHDFTTTYVADLENSLNLEVVRGSGLRLGVDPLGGAGVHFWEPIADRYGLNLTVVNVNVDPTFRFMTLDWDGKIRMDPSSPNAMRSLIALKDQFDVSFACDPDHDRHGIVTRSVGLLPSNHYLSVCIDYLFANRPGWSPDAAVGKTVVSSSMIDRVTTKRGRRLHEVPVGFKWFVDGLLEGSLGFAGEESAGLSFLRKNGSVWTTDKDGFIAALLAAEITATLQRDPGEVYQMLTRELGDPRYSRIEAPANAREKAVLGKLSPRDVPETTLAGDLIQSILTTAPGDGNPIGGVKVIADGGWFAARPSGTEDVYKIYAESFKDEAHLRQIESEAQAIIAKTLAAQL